MENSEQNGVKEHGKVAQNQAEDTTDSPRNEVEKCEDENCNQCQLYKARIAELRSRLAQAKKLLAEKTTGASGSGSTGTLDKKVDPQEPTPTSTEDLTPAQKALSTSVILSTILRNTEESFLLRLRLVCKAWEKEVTALLLISNSQSPSRINLSPRMWSCKNSSNFVRIAYSPKDNVMGKCGLGSLDKLTKLINKGNAAGRQFPCSRFVITCPNLLVCPQLTQFFIQHGHLIKSLTLKFVSAPVPTAAANSTAEGDENSTAPSRPPPPPPPPYPMLIESLRNLLFKWAVNIKYLDIVNIPWPGDSKLRLLSDFPGDLPRDLPNLKILQLDSQGSTATENSRSTEKRRIIEDILNCASNLEKVCGGSYDYKDELTAAKKLNTIRYADISLGYAQPGNDSKIVRLEFIADNIHNLEHLDIGYSFDWSGEGSGQQATWPSGWRGQVDILNRILKNNKDTLKTISSKQLGFLELPGLRIPVLTQVKSINFRVDYGDQFQSVPNLSKEIYFRLFPSRLDLAKTFPKVTKLKLSTFRFFRGLGRPQILDSLLDQPLFETSSPSGLNSVRDLVIECEGGRAHELMEPLSKLVPNLQYLEVKYKDEYESLVGDRTLEQQAEVEATPEFPRLLRAIWEHFPNIQSLYLPGEFYRYVKSPRFFHRDTFSSLMDSAITGLDVETVRKLRKGQGQAGIADQVPGKRDQPSIFDMQNLKFLRMGIQNIPMFSYISAIHGFHKMTDLRVVVEATEREEPSKKTFWTTRKA